jgi:hypothetical protein
MTVIKGELKSGDYVRYDTGLRCGIAKVIEISCERKNFSIVCDLITENFSEYIFDMGEVTRITEKEALFSILGGEDA